MCSLYLLENVHHTWKHCVVSFANQANLLRDQLSDYHKNVAGIKTFK